MEKTLDTAVNINAPAHVIWAVLDDIEKYPEWNPLVPELKGKTMVGRQVEGILTREGMPTVPLRPTLTAIVGARELRWLSERPTPGEFRAEHYFILEPNEDGTTTLIHNEDFAGTFLTQVWDGINTLGRAAYIKMNEALKERAEAFAAKEQKIHSCLDNPASGKVSLQGKTLTCSCAEKPVVITVNAQAYHNHLCGCSKCWKPEDASMALIAVVADGQLTVAENSDKLQVVDETQSIKRYACSSCGTHMVGRVEDKDHHFYGLNFIHPELVTDGLVPAPEFAGFVSSLVENGMEPAHMVSIRVSLKNRGIPSYDVFSPEIMDMIAWHKVKLGKQE
ncbi:glutathione-dependent formaldehyde-activating protein [Marinobacter halodurans]|uniref:Glutathione-dependent formaldehyde-activating protein n=1 Tax=Marinobacter halodurans TaxID=2528979 RepID=A0ABY1ZEW2_9GAMM|nr:SRPBCC family protein [Marinobacter halodurans]TBW48304.1 glutathione-dependent formaldehyde-activating protein [Marinobacter halodurans]